MEVEQIEVTIGELADGYFDDDEGGVTAYDDRLNVRPAYQREFIYPDDARDEVIRTVMGGMPLNVFYWIVNDDDADYEFELLDGQQRTVSICQYVNGDYSIDNGIGFDNLPADKKRAILDYKLTVYLCKGTESEKLHWFRVINIAGKRLNNQELLNAIFTGPWVSDARKYFSRRTSNNPAAKAGASDYMAERFVYGDDRNTNVMDSVERQAYLCHVIKWMADHEGITVEQYMGKHQHDNNAKPLWNEFQRIMRWVKKTFKTAYSDMKNVDWGRLYYEHKDDTVFYVRDGSTHDIDADAIDAEVKRLRVDPDIAYKGIYEFILTGDERCLNFRDFDDRDKKEVYEEQGHKCPICLEAAKLAGKSPDTVDELPFEKMHGDHITPWSKGGKTVKENLQMLCITHNLAKSNKQ